MATVPVELVVRFCVVIFDAFTFELSAAGPVVPFVNTTPVVLAPYPASCSIISSAEMPPLVLAFPLVFWVYRYKPDV